MITSKFIVFEADGGMINISKQCQSKIDFQSGQLLDLLYQFRRRRRSLPFSRPYRAKVGHGNFIRTGRLSRYLLSRGT